MTRLERTSSRFMQWLDDALPTLTPFNCIDLHIDEICDKGASAKAQLDHSLELFAWAGANADERLGGKLVMLMVPLRNSAGLDLAPPAWESLEAQLSPTPPSIYVMDVSAFLQPDAALRYTAPIAVPFAFRSPPAAYYQCWRHPDEPSEEGWARDVRLVSLVLTQTDGAERSA